MLPRHAPLAVAEQFALLAALHPGRIDLGVGRGPGTGPATARALRRADAHDFPQAVTELQAFLGEREWSPGHPYGTIRTVPGPVVPPPLWILGSSTYGARLAAAAGLRSAFAHHFGGGDAEHALRLYRDTFRPSAARDRPRTLITVTVVAADTAAEARRHAPPRNSSGRGSPGGCRTRCCPPTRRRPGSTAPPARSAPRPSSVTRSRSGRSWAG
ncbi:MsnO8 family LLM class oxidoreductase [Streptomyces rubradiris]|uniref:Luciferase-like domain-containing protein n=1 Tax=Streptomyces rubradiris TaxID=285531 RepID=A0ABQ3R385_STRRR|nr:MsnO8 family LLM class oxidoreductase [Streptomyces rubradiris]GHH01462.1 hypothetical protein GCM10018792_16840 [Streptomyces rubradiris]GHI50293.1 hypothetical protein Srubr_01390 [Streptomyces rubradiris]